MTTLGIGLMSGTSLDGVDAALIEISHADAQPNYKIVGQYSEPFSAKLRAELRQLCEPSSARIEKLSSMNTYLGNMYANIVNKTLKNYHLTSDNLSFISSHGQTIFHQPTLNRIDELNIPNTLQIGDISALSYHTDTPVVGNFRVADIAAGGQGAPLVSYVDHLLFQEDQEDVAVQNIGGIGNVTYLPPKQSQSKPVSFDTGPGNMLIDQLVSKFTNGTLSYDRDGEIASKGLTSQQLLNWLMQEPYLYRKYPKTTGRELFGHNYVHHIIASGEKFGLKMPDTIRTVTEWTAETIAFHYRQLNSASPIAKVIIGGGGSRNPVLMNDLRQKLTGSQFLTHNDYGIDNQLKEAMAFAILGHKRLVGEYNQLPVFTGATSSVIMGEVACNTKSAFRKAHELYDFG